jgi:hypothetical protein
MDGDATVDPLDVMDEPWPSVDGRAREFGADLGHLPGVDAALDLAALAVLADPDDLRIDSGVRRRKATRTPHRLRLVRRLLGTSDLAKSEAKLVRSRIAPEPEAAPEAMNPKPRIEDEREGKARPR